MPHVSKIELRGFKSFGTVKTSIPLSRGLTAVVGRNGSGKSNIVDAFCFVFGGRSGKTMRTERFSDFIYAKDRRPIAPFAEVSIHIDNRDGVLSHESRTIVISRRVDRDGKSVLKINGKRVALQEIVDILSPVMGTTEGHNFVMQGEVKKIVEKGPLELRQIIDELAGVAEYEKKKEDANRELQEVDGKLRILQERLEGISREVEKFGKDVRDAQRHRDLNTELERVRGALVQKRYLGLKKRREGLDRSVSSLSDKLRKLQNEASESGKKADSLEEEASRIQTLIDRKRESKVLIDAESLRDRLSTLVDLFKELAQNRKELLKEMESAKKNLGRSREVSELLAGMKRFRDLRGELEGMVEKLEKAGSLEEAKEIVERARKVLREITAVVDALFTSFSKRRVSGVDAACIRDFTELEGRLQAYGEQAERLSRRIADTRARLRSMSSEEMKLRSVISSLEHQKNALTERAKRLRRKERDLQERLRILSAEAGSKRTERTTVDKEIRESKEELAGIKADFTALLRLDKETLENKRSSLQMELETLGEINQRALRDLRDAESRYEDEKRKHDELTADRQAILDFIQKTDERKREVFMRTFVEVSRHFTDIFRELSGTGVGNLRLENEEDPFQGGMELEADFGEGLYRLRGLSGGQKTLTALAFLFALQRYRPTTFYVMDEIDASLDHQNRERVAKFLREFSKDSQMVVITLHDTIAAVADRIFGVTKENGISRILSVDLSGLGD